MELISYPFQEKAEEELLRHIMARLDAKDENEESAQILFLSCVASGKTKMLSSVVNDLMAKYDDIAVLFFSPSLARLHDNAYNEIKSYQWSHLSGKVLDIDSMVAEAKANGGNVPAGTITTIGWSDINKDGARGTITNRHMRIGEEATFASIMETNKTRIIAIYDEGHTNVSRQATIKKMVRPVVEVISTATSQKDQLRKAQEGHHIIQVDTREVAAQGKVKSQIIVNDANMSGVDPKSGLHGDAGWVGLIKAGLHRRAWLENRYRSVGMDVIPLMVIQLPNDDMSEKSDTEKTRTNCRKVKIILRDLGVADDDIVTWLASRRDMDPNKIKDSHHKVLIVKVACATGWNCPRATPLVKLRHPSLSDTLDEQTMGRFLRTTDPQEWISNKKYREDAYLNTAFVFTASEDYDASLNGYVVRSEKVAAKIRNGHKDKWENVRLIKTLPGRKTFASEDKMVSDMAECFNKKFPGEYEETGGKWVVDGDIIRSVASYQQSLGSIMDEIADKGRYTSMGHDDVSMANESVEEGVWGKIERSTTLLTHREVISRAIDRHIDINLCQDGASGLFSKPPTIGEEDPKMKRRDDFFKGIFSNFGQFAQVCMRVINDNTDQGKIVFDGSDSTRAMFSPCEEMYVGTEPQDTPKDSRCAYDKLYGTSQEFRPETEMVEDIMEPVMDSWFKNGTSEADSFVLVIDEDNGVKGRFFPDFLAIKDRVLYIIETKGHFGPKEDLAKDPERDALKASAICKWIRNFKKKSIDASDGIDDIVFGIARKVEGEGWKIYCGDGSDYVNMNSESWKRLGEVMGSEHD